MVIRLRCYISPHYDATNLGNDQNSFLSAKSVNVGNGSSLSIASYGVAIIKPTHFTSLFQLSSLLYTLLISHNLMFVHKLCYDDNIIVKFHANFVFVKDALT